MGDGVPSWGGKQGALRLGKKQKTPQKEQLQPRKKKIRELLGGEKQAGKTTRRRPRIFSHFQKKKKSYLSGGPHKGDSSPRSKTVGGLHLQGPRETCSLIIGTQG